MSSTDPFKALYELFGIEEDPKFYQHNPNTDIEFLSGLDIFKLGYRAIQWDPVLFDYINIDIPPETPKSIYLVDHDSHSIERI